MSNVVANAQQVITPIVESLGFEVVEITYKKEYGENTLTIYIFKKNGVSLSDCELINNALDIPLEQNDITLGQSYMLNISSSGLDRLVVTEDDFRRSLHTELELVFIQPIGKRKHTHGTLIDYNDTTVTLKQKDKEVSYNKSNLSIIRPYIKFK